MHMDVLGEALDMPPADLLPCPSGIRAWLGSWEHGSPHPSLSPEGNDVLRLHYTIPRGCSGKFLECSLAGLRFSVIHFSVLRSHPLPAPLGRGHGRS